MQIHLIKAAQSIIQDADQILAVLKHAFKKDAQAILVNDEQAYIQQVVQHAQQLKAEMTALLAMDAISANELKEKLQSIRHDSRNHINSIIGYTEIIIEDLAVNNSNLEGELLQKVIETVKVILQSVNALQLNLKDKSTDRKKVQIIHPPLKPIKEEVEPPDLAAFKKNFSILVVDDVAENCQLLEKHLIRMGYQNIRIAYDAIQAKQVLAKNQVDLVLLDIDMPGISGIALLEELKHDIAKLQLMVIMVTGSDTIENAIQCIKLGAEDFLTKPIDTEMLRVRIDASLRKKWFLIKQKEYAEYLEIERKRYADLLNAIFPPTIVTELSEKGHVIARSYSNVSMLFADIVGFTQYCDTHSLDEAIQGIQDFSVICEAAASKYNLQKIKTIGDGFLAIAGMLTEHENPVKDCILTAIEILENTKLAPNQWKVRAGIDFGTIIGGVVGHRQYLFDIWGDSVNTAARAQAAAEPDRICVTARAWETVNNECEGRSLGVVFLKGKGIPMELFEFVKMR